MKKKKSKKIKIDSLSIFNEKFTIKNKNDGETTMAISDSYWECIGGNNENGVQSKNK